jgi:hypothetical protein
VDLSGLEINPFFWQIARLNIEFDFYKRSKGLFCYVPTRGIRLMDTFIEGEKATGPVRVAAAER